MTHEDTQFRKYGISSGRAFYGGGRLNILVHLIRRTVSSTCNAVGKNVAKKHFVLEHTLGSPSGELTTFCLFCKQKGAAGVTS